MYWRISIRVTVVAVVLFGGMHNKCLWTLPLEDMGRVVGELSACGERCEEMRNIAQQFLKLLPEGGLVSVEQLRKVRLFLELADCAKTGRWDNFDDVSQKLLPWYKRRWVKRLGIAAVIPLIAVTWKWLQFGGKRRRSNRNKKFVKISKVLQRENVDNASQGVLIGQRAYYDKQQVSLMNRDLRFRILFGENTRERQQPVAEREKGGGQALIFAYLSKEQKVFMVPVTTTYYKSNANESVWGDTVDQKIEYWFKKDIEIIKGLLEEGKIVVVPVDDQKRTTIGQGISNASGDLKLRFVRTFDQLFWKYKTVFLLENEQVVADE